MPDWYGVQHGQKPEMGENGKPNGKQPLAGQGPKMAKKWPEKNAKLPRKSMLRPFFYPFFAGGCFPSGFPCFPMSGFLAICYAVPARHDPNSRKTLCRKVCADFLVPKIQGEIIYAHPPTPPFRPEDLFQREGGGCIF